MNGSLWLQVKGRVRFELSYEPLALPARPAAANPAAASAAARAARGPPKGGTPELDWGELSSAVGAAEAASGLEFCAFVDAAETDTQVGRVRKAGSAEGREGGRLLACLQKPRLAAATKIRSYKSVNIGVLHLNRPPLGAPTLSPEVSLWP